ncbi:hypothetical protein F5Y14DRAFT_441402 [Nemania sp. NC0429]|nr:hypothetical protein F5Y14DRAFT_441402 [Nemania sp. NC0429]
MESIFTLSSRFRKDRATERLHLPAFLAAVGAAAAFQTYSPCPPFTGNVTVNAENIYPDGAEFSPTNCKFYLGSMNNNTLIEHDPYTSVTREIEFPGISHNNDYFVCGVDFSYATGTLYVAVSSSSAWWPTMGGNLTGPNRLIQYSPLADSIIWTANIDDVVAAEVEATGTQFAGFQDMAVDKDSNAYFFATFGNIIVKIDPEGKATKFYSPDPPTDKSWGFGGAFVTMSNKLVVSDAVLDNFAVFDLSSSAPSNPSFIVPKGNPDDFEDSVLECDSLTAPRRYGDKVALCANVADTKFSEHGMITVYTSDDDWETINFVGMINNDFGQFPDVWSTAQVGTADRVYALSSSLPYENRFEFPKTKSTMLVDITDRVDKLVGKFAPSQSGQAHEEL